MHVRPEVPFDYPAVFNIHQSSFPTDAEARLVNSLRKKAHPLISLVAEEGDQVVGHILFSPVTIGGHPELQLMGLAPMAVLPDRQKQGIGSALIDAGLAECRRTGIGAIAVLGHPAFYARFGFLPSVKYDIHSTYDVPPEVFMMLELQDGYLQEVSGTLRYHPLFDEL